MCASWIVGMREVRTVPMSRNRRYHKAANRRATHIRASPATSQATTLWISQMMIYRSDTKSSDTDDNTKRERCGSVEASRYDEEPLHLQYRDLLQTEKEIS